MKTILANLVFLILFILVTGSCSKKQDNLQGPSTPDLKNIVNPATTTYHDNGVIPGVEGVDYGCWGAPTNCLPELEIVGIANIDLVNGFISVINSGSNDDLISFIQHHYTQLTEMYGSAYIDGILDGTYTVTIRGDLTSGKAYVVILNGTTVIVVYPLRS